MHIDRSVLNDIHYIIKIEGGYADLKGDPGGPTMYGISSNFNPTLRLKIVNKTLTVDEAVDYYYHNYYKRSGSLLVMNYPFLRYLLFDCRVWGSLLIVKELQKYISKESGIYLKIDGLFGKRSAAALKSLGAANIVDYNIARWFRDNSERFGKEIAERLMMRQNSLGLPVVNYTKGFMNRTAKTFKYTQELGYEFA